MKEYPTTPDACLCAGSRIRCRELWMCMYQEAKDLCMQQLTRNRRAVILVSGGLESSALACLVAETARNVGRVPYLLHIATDTDLPGTMEVCQALSEKLKLDLDVRDTGLIGYGNLRGFLAALDAVTKQTDVLFAGGRYTDSLAIRKISRQSGAVFATSHFRPWVCMPFLYFRDTDFLGAAAQSGLAKEGILHPAYHEMPMTYRYTQSDGRRYTMPAIGYPWERARMTAPMVRYLRDTHPELFRKVLGAWPDIRWYLEPKPLSLLRQTSMVRA